MDDEGYQVQPGVDAQPSEDRGQGSAAGRSPPWSRGVKAGVAVVFFVFILAVAYRFTDLLLRVVAAGIIAYLLTPLINLITERTPLSRGAAIALTYILVALGFIYAVGTLGLQTFRQITNLIDSVPDLVEGIVEWLSTTEVVEIGPFEVEVASIWGTIDWESAGQQLLRSVVPAVNQGGRTVVAVFSSTVQVLTNILFTFIISVYLAFEMGRLGGYLERAFSDPGYRHDVERLLREFGRIWRAYLRGQIVLGLIIGLAVWTSLGILGVQNAFGLGVLSGLLEFLPVIGPFIGTLAAALFGIFQPENYLGLSPASYAALIVGVMMVIQQIENNVLVPRIVGEALDLHALVVIIGVFMGSSLAGLIGAILAAPVLATTKLLGSYGWRKMFDLPPFPHEEVVHVPDRRPYLVRLLALLNRARQRVREWVAGSA